MLKAAALALLAFTTPASAQFFAGVDVEWQGQFDSAPLWSTLGVSDDGSDQLANLNALPATTIIADCPHSGSVHLSGAWIRKSHQHIWYKNCPLVSSDTTPGVYPIQSNANLTDTVQIADVMDYDLDLTITTPTQGVRAYLMWCDHCKIKYAIIHGGGVGFFRGSDNEFGFISTLGVIQAPGNPGIRDIGNLPLVATSPGMHANVWGHNLNFQVGDGRFQVCQPTGGVGTWLYDPGTNGITYENAYSTGSNSGSVLLVNLIIPLNQGDKYYCDNITFRNISGGARTYANIFPGGLNTGTHNILVSGGTYDGSSSQTNLAALGIGQVKRGPFRFTGTDMSLVRVENVTINNAFLEPIEISGPFPWVSLNNVNLGTPQRVNLRAPLASISGTIGFVWNGGVVASNSVSPFSGISLGDNGATQQTINPMITGVSVSGIDDGQSGITLGNVQGGTLTSSSVTPAVGSISAIGLSLTNDPNGTHGVTATGNDFSAMPVPVVCANGQGNTVTGCP